MKIVRVYATQIGQDIDCEAAGDRSRHRVISYGDGSIRAVLGTPAPIQVLASSRINLKLQTT